MEKIFSRDHVFVQWIVSSSILFRVIWCFIFNFLFSFLSLFSCFVCRPSKNDRWMVVGVMSGVKIFIFLLSWFVWRRCHKNDRVGLGFWVHLFFVVRSRSIQCSRPKFGICQVYLFRVIANYRYVGFAVLIALMIWFVWTCDLNRWALHIYFLNVWEENSGALLRKFCEVRLDGSSFLVGYLCLNNLVTVIIILLFYIESA